MFTENGNKTGKMTAKMCFCLFFIKSQYFNKKIYTKIQNKYIYIYIYIFSIHIVPAPKYRDSIESGGSCTVPSLLFVAVIDSM